MRIDRLRLENFRCFASVECAFAPGVNLLVGANGSGKSSLLKGINVAMGAFFAEQDGSAQQLIEFEDIRIERGKRQESASVWAASDLLGGHWQRSITRDTRSNDRKHTLLARKYGTRFFQDFEQPDGRLIAPLLAHYSTERLFKSGKNSPYDPAGGRRNGYLACLGGQSLRHFIHQWIGHAATRRATLQIKEIASDDKVLGNVEQALRRSLIHLLGLPEDFPLKIYQDPDFDFELFVSYDEEQVPLSYYSDGFRNILYLIIDLVWRASQLNPWLDLEDLGAAIGGLVTIDEIDLHLHPRWQAKAIGLLQALFPKVQFFVSTHSPTVVANLEKGRLYVVDRQGAAAYDDAFFGKHINYVLQHVLGASERHAPTQARLDALFQAIDAGQAPAYGPLLAELSELLGSDDKDLARARALIDWQTSMPNA